MYARIFRTSDDEAGGEADDGRRELAAYTPASAYASARLTYRAHGASGGEAAILAQLYAVLGPHFPRELITNTYVSFKTNPFVVLTGREGTGKAAFINGFAQALVGSESGQLASVNSSRWAERAGARSRGLHERFGSLRFIQTLEEAASPAQTGKLYFMLLRGLSLAELRYYFSELLQTGADGEQRLALPGLPPERHPLLSPNILIAATTHTMRPSPRKERMAQCHAVQIAFRPGLRAPITSLASSIPPSVGLQRTMLAAAVRDIDAARERLRAILGSRELIRLALSAPPAAICHRRPFGPMSLTPEAMLYVANSFSGNGRGLFEPDNDLINARRACEIFAAQHVSAAPEWAVPHITTLRRYL